MIINGSKMWITNGAQADYMCLLANTNQGPAHKSKSLIVLPMNLPGIAIDCLDISSCICVDPFLFSGSMAVSITKNQGNLAYRLPKDQADKHTSHILLGYKTCSIH